MVGYSGITITPKTGNLLKHFCNSSLYNQRVFAIFISAVTPLPLKSIARFNTGCGSREFSKIIVNHTLVDEFVFG